MCVCVCVCVYVCVCVCVCARAHAHTYECTVFLELGGEFYCLKCLDFSVSKQNHDAVVIRHVLTINFPFKELLML